MLLHETDSNRGGAPMDQLLADCPDNWREKIFVSRRPIIPWLRVKEFKIVTLKMIVSSMLMHQSKMERKLREPGYEAFHAMFATPTESGKAGVSRTGKCASASSRWSSQRRIGLTFASSRRRIEAEEDVVDETARSFSIADEQERANGEDCRATKPQAPTVQAPIEEGSNREGGDRARHSGGGAGVDTNALQLVPYARCERLPTAPEGRQEEGVTAPPPTTVALAISAQGIQLAGTLYKRSPMTGMYTRVEAVIEGARLCCGTSVALPSALPSVELSGSNVERLVENRAKLEFTLLTKKSGPERGRAYAFRASTCANAKYGTSVIKR